MRVLVSLTFLGAVTYLIACGTSTVPLQKTALTLSPTPSVVTATPHDLTDAGFAKHVTDLRTRIKTKLGKDDFSIVIERPFVVVGDEPEETVRQRATETVKWAVDLLKKDFFKNDPSAILEIWLFKDDDSYRSHAKVLFNDTPTTPYGYYSRADKALVMNISTGSGTLVHEIVHPLMEANFPGCPPWFNEGMGSLYEQCGERDGHIHGYTNWRLPGLQRAIREKRLVSFEALMAMDASTFYKDDSGSHYAQSRYLCYYLQQRGLLRKFYHEFVSRHGADPSGFKTLKKVLGESDMNSFKTRWEKYVLTLRQGYDVDVD